MNANDTVKSGYTNEKLIEFFEKGISPDEMAKNIRRLNYSLSLTVIRNDDNHNPLDKDWLDGGFFWLNELAEILDPYLNV